MSMAEAGDRDAREKIHVDVAVGVGERRAFTVIEAMPASSEIRWRPGAI
jgi:hypothetical protein